MAEHLMFEMVHFSTFEPTCGISVQINCAVCFRITMTSFNVFFLPRSGSICRSLARLDRPGYDIVVLFSFGFAQQAKKEVTTSLEISMRLEDVKSAFKSWPNYPLAVWLDKVF